MNRNFNMRQKVHSRIKTDKKERNIQHIALQLQKKEIISNVGVSERYDTVIFYLYVSSGPRQAFLH